MTKHSPWPKPSAGNERKKALISRLMARKPKDSDSVQEKLEGKVVDTAAPVEEALLIPSPFLAAKPGLAGVTARMRDEPTVSLGPEPWITGLMGDMLEVSATPEVRLCLVWPGRVVSLPLIAAFASLERMAIRDLRGLRTVLYPSKQTSFIAFNDLLLDRGGLLDLASRMFELGSASENTKLSVLRACDGKAKLLMSLGTIQRMHPESPSPTVAELTPHFHFNTDTKSWGTYAERFFARSLKKIDRRSQKQDLREVKALLGEALNAPDALFGIPYGTKKEVWSAALSSKAFSVNKPELILLNATRDMQRTDFRSIRNIPDFVKITQEKQPQAGILIVTDEPITFFNLKKQLQERAQVKTKSRVYLSQDGYGFSRTPNEPGWKPASPTLKHYHFHILDRPATGVALRFLSIAQEMTPDSPEEKVCRLAGHYILQACHMPGGLNDLNEWISSAQLEDSVISRLTWPAQAAAILSLVQKGAFGAMSVQIEQALEKTITLLNQWQEATPMALRLAVELQRVADNPETNVAVVFPRKHYAEIAKLFLTRHFKNTTTPFELFENRVQFLTQPEVTPLLESDGQATRIIYVGLNDEILRTFLTKESALSGSVVLISYKAALELDIALAALITIPELKPYFTRMIPLHKELAKKLKDVENPIPSERLLSKALIFNFDLQSNSANTDTDPSLYRLVLDEIGTVTVGRRVFRYEPDNDPPFGQVDVKDIKEGDMVFCMTDEIRDAIEATLKSYGYENLSKNLSDILRQYHKEVRNRSVSMFPAKYQKARIEAICTRITEIDPSLKGIASSRVGYWLSVDQNSDDNRPHAARDSKAFFAFAKALQLPEALIAPFWFVAVQQTRNESRAAGRWMSDFYSNILFHPESAQVYQKIKTEDISRLHQESIKALFKVIKIIPPQPE